jgi:hypothetical protein
VEGEGGFVEHESQGECLADHTYAVLEPELPALYFWWSLETLTTSQWRKSFSTLYVPQWLLMLIRCFSVSVIVCPACAPKVAYLCFPAFLLSLIPFSDLPRLAILFFSLSPFGNGTGIIRDTSLMLVN